MRFKMSNISYGFFTQSEKKTFQVQIFFYETLSMNSEIYSDFDCYVTLQGQCV